MCNLVSLNLDLSLFIVAFGAVCQFGANFIKYLSLCHPVSVSAKTVLCYVD